MRSAEMTDRIDMILSSLQATSEDVEARRRVAASLHPPAGPDVRVAEVDEAGVRGELLVAEGASEASTVLLVHGGGYVAGSPEIVRGFAGRLSRAAGVRLFDVAYRLAPEHRCPGAVEDVVAGYRWLLETGTPAHRLVLGGQSAGGGIALAALLVLKERGVPLPSGCFVLSPTTDMTMSSPSLTADGMDDPLLRDLEPMRRNRALYLGDLDAASPLASPLFGDLSGLPPIHIEVSASERLVDDSRRFAEAAEAAGVPVRVVETDGALHNFPNLAPDTPEGRDANARIAEVVRGWVR